MGQEGLKRSLAVSAIGMRFGQGARPGSRTACVAPTSQNHVGTPLRTVGLSRERGRILGLAAMDRFRHLSSVRGHLLAWRMCAVRQS